MAGRLRLGRVSHARRGWVGHRSGRPACDDRGSATLSLVVAFPAVLVLLLVTVQTALVFHARHIAQAAAAEGLRDARIYSGSQAAGQRAAEAFLTQTAGDLLTNRTVTTVRTPVRARVDVRGTALSLLPGVHLRVRGRAEGPVERFVPDTESRP